MMTGKKIQLSFLLQNNYLNWKTLYSLFSVKFMLNVFDMDLLQ